MLKAGLEATGTDRDTSGRGRTKGKRKTSSKLTEKKKSERSVTLFALKTFKIHTTRATFHVSTLAKIRITSNQGHAIKALFFF